MNAQDACLAALHAAEEAASLVCRVHPWQIKLEVGEGRAVRDGGWRGAIKKALIP